MSETGHVTPISEVPLHGWAFDDSYTWWACAEPERPFDQEVAIDFRCEKCRMHVEAQVRALNDQRLGVMESGPFHGLSVTLLEALEMSKDAPEQAKR